LSLSCFAFIKSLLLKANEQAVEGTCYMYTLSWKLLVCGLCMVLMCPCKREDRAILDKDLDTEVLTHWMPFVCHTTMQLHFIDRKRKTKKLRWSLNRPLTQTGPPSGLSLAGQLATVGPCMSTKSGTSLLISSFKSCSDIPSLLHNSIKPGSDSVCASKS